MITAHAPLRISFGGGGTDLPVYYERFGGMVVSATITAACHVSIRPNPQDGVRIVSHDFRRVIHVPACQPVELREPLSLPRAVLAWFATRDLLPSQIEIAMNADAPPGSGLGSSSAMTVALVSALARHIGLPMSARMLAEAASQIEMEILERPIGRQDHYASAFGGLNTITFSSSGVVVTPLGVQPTIVQALQDHLLLVSTCRTRDSANVLRPQRAATGSDVDVITRLHRLKELAAAMAGALVMGDLPGFGALLDEGWQLKRGLACGVSSPDIDRWYDIARDAGAYGGKIVGAGGGGYFLFCVSPHRRPNVLAKLEAAGLSPFPFLLEQRGCVTDGEIVGTPIAAVAR